MEIFTTLPWWQMALLVLGIWTLVSLFCGAVYVAVMVRYKKNVKRTDDARSIADKTLDYQKGSVYRPW